MVKRLESQIIKKKNWSEGLRQDKQNQLNEGKHY